MPFSFMDESFRKAVIDCALQVNPKISRSCPLSTLADGVLNLPPGSIEEIRSLVQRLVLYSRAPPAMMHVNQLLFCTIPPSGHESSYQSSNFDPEKFQQFFTPPLILDRSAEIGYVLDKDLSENLSSIETNVDDLLRGTILQAAVLVENQFGILYPSPKELLMAKTATYTGKNLPADEALVDQAFSKATEAALERQNLKSFLSIIIEIIVAAVEAAGILQSNSKSCLHLVRYIAAAIDEAAMDTGMKIALAERLIFSCVPHPEESLGSVALLHCFRETILRELSVDSLAEALIAAIERLPADDTVKRLLRQVIKTCSVQWTAGEDSYCSESEGTIGIVEESFYPLSLESICASDAEDNSFETPIRISATEGTIDIVEGSLNSSCNGKIAEDSYLSSQTAICITEASICCDLLDADTPVAHRIGIKTKFKVSAKKH